MMFAEDIINPVIRKYPCSGAWTIPISSLDKREREYFPRFSPAARTAVVLGYHIVTKYEWTWFEKENGLHHCHADDHSKKIYNDIADAFGVHGFRTAMVPYPGESGIQFRSVAQSAGAGEIGMNTFLLHPLWGPWIQLSLLATDALSKDTPVYHKPVCTRCGECVLACPAGAIRQDSFDGLRCRSYRTEKGEYIPFGPKKEFRYCTTCADVCPVGQKPRN
ncbi:MAG: 4Fe-4S double cluster binding domain-containing protein [Methanoregula sp.]